VARALPPRIHSVVNARSDLPIPPFLAHPCLCLQCSRAACVRCPRLGIHSLVNVRSIPSSSCEPVLACSARIACVRCTPPRAWQPTGPLPPSAPLRRAGRSQHERRQSRACIPPLHASRPNRCGLLQSVQGWWVKREQHVRCLCWVRESAEP